MPKKVYTLYTRCDEGREPKVRLSYPDTDRVGHKIGRTYRSVPRYGYRRGALIETFTRYDDMVAHAKSLAVTIGMPQSRIWDIFDWNLDVK